MTRIDLDEENRLLKAEVMRLEAELKQRDNLIILLQSQLRDLFTERSATVVLPSYPNEDTGIKRETGPDSEDFDPQCYNLPKSASLEPPRRMEMEMQQQQQQQQLVAQNPKQRQPQSHTKDDDSTPKMTTMKHYSNQHKSDGGTTSGKSADHNNDTSDNKLVVVVDESQQLADSTVASFRPALKVAGLKSSRGAIKALPRELSIANDDDDEVTKYSVDDGNPTFEMEKTEMRDAYNARGLYTGTVSRKQQLPHGKGTMEYHLAGRIYSGDWHMGHWHGRGVIRTSEGVYEGEVFNDLKEGVGVFCYQGGRRFEGIFEKDEAVHGTLTFPDKSRYVGELSNGTRHGKGTYYFCDGSIYEGQSVKDRFEGHGKMTWTDGGWYEGEWLGGQINGYGMEIRPDGSLRHRGLWREGFPIRNQTK